MDEQCQLYSNQGTVLTGQGAPKRDLFQNGQLHGASHVWIWRKSNGNIEVLVQKRAAHKSTWPNRYDISAAGHIDLGEKPVAAALREAQEEIGLQINADDLVFFCAHRAYLVAENGYLENEIQHLYLLELPNDGDFTLQEQEVSSLEWKHLDELKSEYMTEKYTPHGDVYYRTVIAAIERESNATE
jgi:isopentenyl-diphosphate Delta-isomerase